MSKSLGYTQKTLQHTVIILPNLIEPRNGFDVAGSNCYWTTNYVAHGATSYANSNVKFSFIIPSNYKVGTNIVIKYDSIAVGAVANAGNKVSIIIAGNTDSLALDITDSVSFFSPLTAATSQTTYSGTIVVATYPVEANDHIQVRLNFGDVGVTNIIYTFNYRLEVQVEELD